MLLVFLVRVCAGLVYRYALNVLLWSIVWEIVSWTWFHIYVCNCLHERPWANKKVVRTKCLVLTVVAFNRLSSPCRGEEIAVGLPALGLYSPPEVVHKSDRNLVYF